MRDLEQFQFPNGGYKVSVYRKTDIIDSIDDDTLDKDLMLELVKTVERQAIKELNAGEWAGIPYLGSLRHSETSIFIKKNKSWDVLQEARETLSEEQFVAFRQNYFTEIYKNVKLERVYRYVTSIYAKKNYKIYSRFLKVAKSRNITDLDSYSRFMCYSSIYIAPVKLETEEEL